MFITTAGRTEPHLIEMAKEIAFELQVKYVPRRKLSVHTLQQNYKDDCLVVGKERLEMYPLGEAKPFFFHPNSAMFRIKRLLRGEHDPFLQATKLQNGDRFLDCTLGLASDSIVAAYAVGNEGVAIGLEGNRYLAYIVANGLKEWDSGLAVMDAAMRKIKVESSMALQYLQTVDDNHFDCVYFDPMFDDLIDESDGIEALRRFAVYNDLNEILIKEAIRVAKRRIVLKDHFRSNRFNKYGFEVHVRETAKFHFGVIEK